MERESDKSTEKLPNRGWIKLSRLIAESAEFWEIKPLPPILAMIDLFLLVNSRIGKIFFDDSELWLGKGERLISLEQLSDRWGWSVTKVRTYLDKWNVGRRLVGKARKKATIVDVSDCFYWKVVHNGAVEKNDENELEKTTEDTENTTLYEFLSHLKKSQERIEKNTNKTDNKYNYIETPVSKSGKPLNQQQLKVALANSYFVQLDKVEGENYSLMGQIIADYGILMVLAKLDQLVLDRREFDNQEHAERYLIAALKQSVLKLDAPVEFVERELTLSDVIAERESRPILRFEDVLKEREN